MIMKSLSLIHAIVLMHEKTRLKKTIRLDERIARFDATPENMALARQLSDRVLGRNLTSLPWETKILFLLIEEMAEKECRLRKIERESFRFTRERVRLNTGWSDPQLKLHLSCLVDLRYFLPHQEGRILQYELLCNSKSKTTIDMSGDQKNC